MGPGVAVAGWIATLVLGWPLVVLLQHRGRPVSWLPFLLTGAAGGLLLSRFFWPRTPLLIVSILSGLCAAAAVWIYVAWPAPGRRIEILDP